MRAVLQRVSSASVTINHAERRSIEGGFVVLLGVTHADDENAVRLLADKLVHLRVFEDDGGLMNRSLLDVGGALLVVSNFTLYADAKKGRRPSFTNAAPPQEAEALYRTFVAYLEERVPGRVETGEFGAHMEIALVNDGPVTLILDTDTL